MKISRLLSSSWFAGLLFTALFMWAFLSGFYPLELMENKVYDTLARLNQPDEAVPVTVVGIDQKSINEIGPWPWPRKYMAEAVAHLTGLGARVIAVRIHFPGREPNAGLSELRRIRMETAKDRRLMKNRGVKKIYRELKRAEKEADHDAQLVSAVKKSRRVILPVLALGETGTSDSSRGPAYLKRNSLPVGRIKSREEGKSALARLFGSAKSVIRAGALMPPYPELASAARALGVSNLYPDRDGIVRRAVLFVRHGKRLYPSFELQSVLKYFGEDEKAIRISGERKGLLTIKTPKTEVALDSGYGMLAAYDTRGINIPVYSFSDLVGGRLSEKDIRGKIVVLGFSGEGISGMDPSGMDRKNVPVVAASIMAAILNGAYYARPAWALLVESSVIVYFGLLAIFLVPRTRKKTGILILGMFMFTWGTVSTGLFMAFGVWLKTASPLVSGGLVYSVVLGSHTILGRKSHISKESVESFKMLGLTLQGQGMLDLAFEKFMKCPVDDESVRGLLYNLGLDFERKRMFNKAVAVYEHMLRAGIYKDIQERIEKLRTVSDPFAGSEREGSDEHTMLLSDTLTKPTVGRYEIVEELGRGAMGTVYLGWDPAINRNVAIKTLKYEDMDEDELREFKERFFREAEAAGALSHPNIMTIYDIGEEHDMAYIAMELLKGRDLREHTSRGNLLPPREVLRIVRDVAEALDYAHSRAVVHRDIKPANIMLLEDGTVKVADFGIATIMASAETAGSTTVIGTPNYMSPEQIEGRRVDGRADLFSLGIVMYELLAGEKPFRAENMAELMKNITKGEFIPLESVDPELPACCIEIVNRLLARSLRQRYKNGRAVAEDITACMKYI